MTWKTIYTLLIAGAALGVLLDPARFISGAHELLPTMWRRIAWVLATMLFSQLLGIIDRVIVFRRSRVESDSYNASRQLLLLFGPLLFVFLLITLICALDFPLLSEKLAMTEKRAFGVFGFAWIGGAFIGLSSTRLARERGVYPLRKSDGSSKFGRP